MSEPNWKNRTLWTGDNLDIMRGMNSGSVDLIYLDPPFNSKKNYAAPIGSQAAGAAFQDTWSLDDVKREWVEDIEADNTATWSAITAAGFTNGESAQAYLTYMAIRLIEMRRILKPAGSIYLHCDSTMSHYLKLMMDAVFGHKNFRNEIIWLRRQERHNLARNFMGRAHDIIFWYAKTRSHHYNIQYLPHSEVYLASTYNKRDEQGRYTTFPCTNETGGNKPYEFRGITRAWRFEPSHMEELFQAGMLVQPRPGSPFRYKKYLDDTEGVKLQDLWSDVPGARGKERQGYPTQKPLALLDRIIKASSRPGDMVLDPFCGCATTCVAAERLNRQWSGIDIEPKARDLVVSRLQQQADEGALFKGALPEIHHLKRPPKRMDADTPQRSKNIKMVLYERQKGQCAGNCGPDGKGRRLDLDLFEVDHVVPRSKGGADVDDNLQLLCPTCNRRKGSRTMKYLLG